MEERFGFDIRRLEGESMTALCEEFGISRKTGHKIFARYKEHGLEALRDRPRTPKCNANRLPMPVEALIVRLKREKPHWGARKLRELLAKRLGDGVPVPARSTIHAVLDRHGLVEHARARRPRATGTPLGEAVAPNDIRRTDFKGEFRLGDRRWCFPLTATDRLSRFLLMCEALEGTAEAPVFTAFHRLFEERGRQIKAGHGTSYPPSIGRSGRKALLDNLDEDEKLTLAVDTAIRDTAQAGWRGNRMKTRMVLRCLIDVLGSEDEAHSDIPGLEAGQHSAAKCFRSLQ